MAVSNLILDSFWVDKSKYMDAEKTFHESLSNASLTPLADEVAKTRQRLIEIRGNIDNGNTSCSVDAGVVKFLEKKISEFNNILTTVQKQLDNFDRRLTNLEGRQPGGKPSASKAPSTSKAANDEEDDGVDLFASDSDDDAEAEKIKQERLAAYDAKKSKKPTLIAKSSIILDVKPWDDETDMKQMESRVREITMDGLLWGASKLVPLAYGIHKLQINCVVEDDKVSIDALQEEIEGIEDFVQSVDIAAFNKI